jgi:mannosyltransferase OCH1-like enzyme
MKESHEKRSQELEELGVILPDTQPPASLLDIDTHAALREHLVRRENRSKHLIQAEAVADVYQRGCVDRKAPGEGTLHAFFHRSDGSFHDQGIPKHIFVPDVVSWQRPRPGKPASFVHLTFDETEMRLLIADNYLPLLNTFDSLKRLDDRIHLWSICALYFYGGVFLGPNTAVHADVVRDIVESSANGLFDGIHNHCSSPTGLAVFNKSENSNGKSSIDVLMIAATPRHPHLRCVMNHLESASDSVQASQVLESFFLDDTWESTHTFHHLTKTRHEAPWEMLTTQCGYGHAHTQECCHGMNFHEIQELPVDGISPTQGSLYVQLLELEAPDESEVNVVKVHVKEKEGTEAPVKSEKIFLEDVMNKKGIEPNWLCTRCLKTSLYGTLETCSKVCSSGYENLMCYAPDDPEKARVDVEVTVNTTKATAKRIPRIIHQTWFEELSADRYPELVRLQNSWKRSGWEYRFYNDETARNFIVDNFPSRFADAFDALIPGAYKADLFRYLVLMKEGGVYADVDILLDASLDDFVTPSLSFFAPRDVVCEYAGEPFCLWNGLIGSAPGHPFIIRAVERLVNLILERADLYDMERAVCRRVGRKMENWKVRAEPLLLASGPCALGVAVNDAIGRESLAKLDIGWIPSDAIKDESGQDHGDALILVGDKFDLGSFRISDPERSYILASTDLPDVTKESRELSNPTRGELRRRQQRHGPLPHYSEAAKGEFVWGVHNVYHDNLVNNEELKFRVVYS